MTSPSVVTQPNTDETPGASAEGGGSPMALVSSTEALDVQSPEVSLENLRDEDIDDGLLDPEAIIEARPEWGDINTASNAASMDAPVPAPMAAAHVNMFWNAEINGLGSITDGSGTLKNAFEQMFGIVDDDGKKKDGDDDDGWGDYADAQERRAEAKREIDRTLSEHELDDLPWQGDMNDNWNIDGISASRLTLYNAAKAVRKKLPTLAKDNNWTDAERADQEHWLSEYERLIKAGDKAGAEQVSQQHFKPETREAVVQTASKDMKVNAHVSAETAKAGTAVESNAAISTDARTDLISAASTFPPERSELARHQSEKPSASVSGLTHPPDFELTPTFTAVADPDPAQPSAMPAPVELANAAPAKSAPPALDQTFSLQ